MGLILTRVITLILVLLVSFLGYQGYTYYNINQKNIVDSKKVSVVLPDFYNIGINDTLLASYLLKIGYFQFNKEITYDGVFNKNWLPLSYNFCNSKIGSDIYGINDDFDKDGLAGVNDKYPYDYSNGDSSVRSSDTLDFDKDGVPNKFDMDADGNSVQDIYQALCFDGMDDKTKEQRRGFWGNDGNKMISDPEIYKENIKTLLKSKIPNGFIENEEAFKQGISVVYNKLLYSDDIIYSIDGKNYYITRKEILNETDTK